MITERIPDCNRTVEDELYAQCRVAMNRCRSSGDHDSGTYSRFAICGSEATEVAVERRYDKASGKRRTILLEPLVRHHQHIRPFIFLVLYYSGAPQRFSFRSLDELCEWAEIARTTLYRWRSLYLEELRLWLMTIAPNLSAALKDQYWFGLKAVFSQKVFLAPAATQDYDGDVSEVATS